MSRSFGWSRVAEDLTTRRAVPDDRAGIRSILEMAGVVPGAVETRIDDGHLLVGTRDPDGEILGALVAPESVPRRDRPTGIERPSAVGAHIVAIAVRPRVRDTGVGSMLVRAAGREWGSLTAAFEPDIRPFYESLEFEILTTLPDGRLFAVRRTPVA